MALDDESVPFIFIGILIMCGNLFVCILYYQHNVLHTVANRLVISFAVCDMMIALLFIPLYIFSHDFSTYIAALSSFGSLLNLLALTYERHVAIFHALRYHEVLSRKRIHLLMAEVWSSTLFITLFPLPWEVTLPIETFLKFHRVYSGILTTIITLVIIVISLVYLRIFNVNRHHLRKNRDIARFGVASDEGGGGQATKMSGGLLQQLMRQQSKADEGGLQVSKFPNCIVDPMHSNSSGIELVERNIQEEDFLEIKEVKKNSIISSPLARPYRQQSAIVTDAFSHVHDPCEVKENGRECGIEKIHVIESDFSDSRTQASDTNMERKQGRYGRSFVAMFSQTGTQSYHKFQTAKGILSEIKAARVIALIFALNCLCWLPIIVINFSDVIAPKDAALFISPTFVTVSLYLFVMNSMFNPFIYALFKRDFRKVISRRLRLLKIRLSLA